MKAKKILAILLAIAVILPNMLFMTSVYAEFDAYQVIEAKNYDRKLSYKSSGAFENLSNRVGSVWSTDYLAFPDVNFGKQAPVRMEATAGARDGYAKELKIMIDDPKSTPIAIVPITIDNFSVPYTNSVMLETEVTGIHTVYVTTVSSTMNFYNFQFFGIEPERMTYKAYSGSSGFEDVEDADFDRDIDLLKQLGMLPFDGTIFDEKLPVNRGEFAMSIYGMYVDTIEKAKIEEEELKTLGKKKAPVETGFSDVDPSSQVAEAVAYLSDYGIMNGVGEEQFAPAEFISYMDALTVIVRLLGYKEAAEEAGGYPGGYQKIASRQKLLSGDASGILCRGDFVSLLCRTLEAEFLVPTGVKEDYTKYERYQGILSDTRKVYTGTGVLMGTAYSSLAIPDTDLAPNTVVIDDVTYNTGYTGAEGLLGIECEYYYKEANGVKTLCAIVPYGKTLVTDIDTQYFDIINIANDEIIYTKKGSDIEEEVELKTDKYVIYNGVASEKAFMDSFANRASFKGKIRVVDNDNDTQTIAIEEYADYIIESIDADKTGLVAKNNKGKVDWGDNDFAIMENAVGEEVKAKEIEPGSLITVYESKNTTGRKLVRIYFAESTMQGKVNKIENGKIYINDKIYNISNNAETPKLGQESTFKLNMYGDIVSASPVEPNDWQTGMFAGQSVTHVGFDTMPKVKLVNADGKCIIYEFADRVTADGVVINSGAALITGEGTDFRGLNDILKTEVVRYRVNSDGKLFAIDTKETVKDNQNDLLKCIYNNEEYCTQYGLSKSNIYFNYNSTQQTLFAKGSGGNGTNTVYSAFFAPNAAKVFVLYNPEDIDGKCIVGDAKTILGSGKKLMGDLYSTTGDDYVADVMVWSHEFLSQGGFTTSAHFVYESYAEGLDEDGDPVMLIKGWQEGGKVQYMIDMTGKHDVDTSATKAPAKILDARTGDVFRLKVYPDKTIYSIEARVFRDGKKDSVTGLTAPISADTREAGTDLQGRTAYGKVLYRTNEFVVIDLGAKKKPDGTLSSDRQTEIVNISNILVCMVSKVDGKYYVESASKANVAKDDVVFVHFQDNQAESLIIFDYEVDGI